MTDIPSPQPAHTPGPWTCEAAYGNNGLRIDSEASGSLGHVRAFIPSGEMRHGSEVLTRWEEGFANARLIAAAPELLEALTMALEIGDQCSRGFLATFQEKARVAISKATGAQA